MMVRMEIQRIIRREIWMFAVCARVCMYNSVFVSMCCFRFACLQNGFFFSKKYMRKRLRDIG